MNRLPAALLAAFLLLFGAGFGRAADTFEAPLPPIQFGQSAALSGSVSQLGLQIQVGIQAAFDAQNRQGGIHGRRLVLQTLDDEYEPERAIANAQKFIADDAIVGLIGVVGTPTSMAILDMLENAAIGLLAPMTGAAELRQQANVLNIRGSYGQEVESIIHWLVDREQLRRIAVLFQDDSYGRAGLQALSQSLAVRNLRIHGQGSYLRNTVAVKRALLEIVEAQPQAVLLVATYPAAAAFIRWSRQLKFTPRLVNLSFVGSEALAEALDGVTSGVYVSQVVPLPTDTSLPIVQSYQSALAAVAPDLAPSFASLEGYLAGRAAIEILHSTNGVIDRHAFLEALRATHSMTLDGEVLSLAGEDGGTPIVLTQFNPQGQSVMLPEHLLLEH
ncbi:MAG: ABC transporter substrate-binding protein [Pseudomonadota bacterium]